MADKVFAVRFKKAMDAKQMKQVDVLRAAADAGVKLGKGQISQYVSGKAVPRANIGHFLADILEVDMQWLYGKEEEKQQAAEHIGSAADAGNRERIMEMREFRKSTKLDNVLYDVRGPVVDAAA